MPTVTRAMVVNGVQFSTYSQAKEKLVANGYLSENIYLHLCSSLISGFFTTITSLPVDIVKTRIQNMKKSSNSQNVGALVSSKFDSLLYRDF